MLEQNLNITIGGVTSSMRAIMWDKFRVTRQHTLTDTAPKMTEVIDHTPGKTGGDGVDRHLIQFVREQMPAELVVGRSTKPVVINITFQNPTGVPVATAVATFEGLLDQLGYALKQGATSLVPSILANEG